MAKIAKRPASAEKPAVILTFKHNGSDFRLVWIPKSGRTSNAHGVVEIRGSDAIGDTTWHHVRNFYPPDGGRDDNDTLRDVIFHKLLDRVRKGKA